MTRFLKGVFITLSFLALVTFAYSDIHVQTLPARPATPPSFESVSIKTVPFVLQKGEDNAKQFYRKNTP